jgi:hypothetical protein
MMRSWLSLFHNVADLETRTKSEIASQDKTGHTTRVSSTTSLTYCIFKEQLTQ